MRQKTGAQRPHASHMPPGVPPRLFPNMQTQPPPCCEALHLPQEMDLKSSVNKQTKTLFLTKMFLFIFTFKRNKLGNIFVLKWLTPVNTKDGYLVCPWFVFQLLLRSLRSRNPQAV